MHKLVYVIMCYDMWLCEICVQLGYILISAMWEQVWLFLILWSFDTSVGSIELLTWFDVAYDVLISEH